MIKNKLIFRKTIYTILFLCVIPCDLGKIIPNSIVQCISYGAEFLTLLYTFLLLPRLNKIDKERKKIINKTTLYFAAIIVLNMIAVLSNTYNSSINVLIRRTASMVCVYSIIILMILKNKDTEFIIEGLKKACGIYVFISILLYAFIPSIGRYNAGYNVYTFEGIAENRNGYIEFALLYLICIAYTARDKIRIINAIEFIITVFTIILTKSATSIIITFLLCLAIFWETIIKKNVNYNMIFKFILGIWLVFFIVLFINPNFSFIAVYFNKSSTLSGRTILWKRGIELIKKKPIIGYGYDNTMYKDTISKEYKRVFDTNNSHNGVLDLIINSGIIGCVLTINYIFLLLQIHNKEKYKGKNKYFLLYILAAFIRGITESCFYYSHILLYIMLILYCLSDKESGYIREKDEK